MSNQIVQRDTQNLMDGWIEAEEQGEVFPVPFDTAWAIAGYSTKANAKRGIKDLIEGVDFSSIVMKNGQRGRSSDFIAMSCDAFKHFCLMAKTKEGREVRDYFIGAEKKWKETRLQFPEIAAQVEDSVNMMNLKIELAKVEAMRARSEEKILSIRQYVVQCCPETVQQKILGFTEVKTVEYRDRVLHNDQVIRNGETISKTEMCRRLGFISKTGSPNYKRLNQFLINAQVPQDAWTLTASIRENEELRIERWAEIERKFFDGDRDLFVGE